GNYSSIRTDCGMGVRNGGHRVAGGRAGREGDSPPSQHAPHAGRGRAGSADVGRGSSLYRLVHQYGSRIGRAWSGLPEPFWNAVLWSAQTAADSVIFSLSLYNSWPDLACYRPEGSFLLGTNTYRYKNTLESWDGHQQCKKHSYVTRAAYRVSLTQVIRRGVY